MSNKGIGADTCGIVNAAEADAPQPSRRWPNASMSR
jgi:hypothetical protein